MSDKSRRILENFARGIPHLPEASKDWLLGVSEGIALVDRADETRRKSEETSASAFDGVKAV